MVWRWNGSGFLPGVPERDIEETEAEELGITELLTAAPAYSLEADAEEEQGADDDGEDADAEAEPGADAPAEDTAVDVT